MVAPLSRARVVCGTFALVTLPVEPKFNLGNICLLDSNIARTYSIFLLTQLKGPASHIRRTDGFWFSCP